MDRESGVNRCKFSPLGQISNEILLYSTGNYILFSTSHLWWSRMEDNVEKRMYICMCDWVTLLYSRKWTEHCKPAIMKRIKIIKKNFLRGNLNLHSFHYEYITCLLNKFFSEILCSYILSVFPLIFFSYKFVRALC